ncbi:S8 family serine peptidase [Embleya sp. NPDC008237]|uniref:S8 family serine peptidase n=1 Tax=Embleya sp. NPDC008237 TaxID=3363978 RepID=UPI0036E8AC31
MLALIIFQAFFGGTSVRKRAIFLAPFAAMLMLLTAIGPARATDYTQVTDSWALARITQTGPVAAPGNGRTYNYTTHSQGEGVNAYIIDAGIDIDHPDFGGRAQVKYDPFGNGPNDCTGHGTGMAESLGGATYGVAKKVNLIAVNAENCHGSWAWQDYYNAIMWVKDNAVKPAVAVISHNWNGAGYFGQLGQLTQAVNDLSNSGVSVVVSAGNVGGPVPYCLFPWLCVSAGPDAQRWAVDNPPANAGQAIVVMGTSPDDTVPLNNRVTPDCISTNTGQPVNAWSTVGGDIYAPGFPVMTIREVPNAHNAPFGYDCGTSYAAPITAGVVALYKATYGDAPSPTVKAWILDHATVGAITNNPPQDGTNANTYTPNRLLNTAGL